jgi:hypothetical protein
MAVCRVSYLDAEGVAHSIRVEADTLYEAVALAAHRFTKGNWAGLPPGLGSQFHVEVLPEAPIKYSVNLSQVKDFAEHGPVSGPSQILKKQRIRTLLGIPD